MKRIGIYNPYIETKGGGEKICLALAEALAQLPDVEVSLITHKKVSLPHLGDYFQIDTSRIQSRVINFDTPFMQFISHLPFPAGIRNLIYDVRALKSMKKAKFDIFINNCYQSNLPNPSKVGVYMCMFPQKIKHVDDGQKISPIKAVYGFVLKRLSKLLLNPGKKHAVYTYQLITANSAYTQSYIKKYWDRDSEILYPFGEDMLVKGPLKKDKIILNVGRFFENIGESHNKRQDFMIETFSQMTDLQKAGWQLHLAGSVAEDVGGLRYILELQRVAKGFPIHFHFNTSFQELRELDNKATIYWHATGYGSDPAQHPEKQEHFGITTVEAMSAKAIPVVIHSAGQKESVIDGKNGFFWDTPEELRTKTTMVAGMSADELKPLQDNARDRFKDYDKAAFQKAVSRIFDPVIS